MVKDVIRLDSLNMEELAGVVSIYPWYAGAREEMCRRMAAMGADVWSEERFAEYALYMESRKTVYDMLKAGKQAAAYADGAIPEPPAEEKSAPAVVREILMVGGDYFSKEEYARVHEASDDLIASSCGVPREQKTDENYGENLPLADYLYTETLASIYAEQGYFEQAKEIYSKLGLRYPEKNAYFAALIEKIENKTI